MSGRLDFAVLLSDADAVLLAGEALLQQERGAGIFDKVGALGAHARLPGFDVTLCCSPFAVETLRLTKFDPAAGCRAVAWPRVDDAKVRRLMKPGEIVVRAMMPFEVEGFARDLGPESLRAPALRIDREGPGWVDGAILRLRRSKPVGGYLIADPARRYVRDVVTPAQLYLGRHPKWAWVEDVNRYAEGLAWKFPITAADMAAALFLHCERLAADWWKARRMPQSWEGLYRICQGARARVQYYPPSRTCTNEHPSCW
jgi:hypothetical protein